MAITEARVNVWVKPGEPLRESDWKSVGFDSLADYIKSLEEEGMRGYKSNGKAADSGKHLPLATFGVYDPRTGEKKVKLVCKDYSDLPTEDVTQEEVTKKSANICPIVVFNHGDR